MFPGNHLSLKMTNSIKGLAILAVLAIHILSSDLFQLSNPSVEGGVELFINQTSRFAVPLFFVLSGFGLEISKKYSLSYIEFVRSRIIKLIPLYLLWTVIYHFVNNRGFNFVSILGSLVGQSSPQMYYVVVLFFFYLLYFNIRKIAIRTLGMLFLLVVTLVSQLVSIWWPVLGMGGLNPLNWLFYFAFGIWICTNPLKIKKNTLISLFIFSMVAVMASSVFVSGTAMRPSVILYSIVLLILLSVYFNLDKSRLLVFLGKNSYSIYLSELNPKNWSEV